MEIHLKLGVAFRALIMSVGIPGNILVMLVYGRKRPKTSTDVYILGLAAADLSVCLVMPLKVYASINQNNYTNAGLCKLTHYFSLIGTFLSMFLTICITVDRYFAVCRPLKRFVTPGRARNTVVSCFAMSAGVGSVALFSAGIRRYGPVATCSVAATHERIIHIYSFLILGLYCLSLLTIIFMYTSIYKTLRNKARTFKAWSLRHSDTQRDAKSVKTVFNLNKRESENKTSSRSQKPNPVRKSISNLAFKDNRIKPQDTREARKLETATGTKPSGEGSASLEPRDGTENAVTLSLSPQLINEQLSSYPRLTNIDLPAPMINTTLKSLHDGSIPRSFHQLFLRAGNEILEGGNRIPIDKYRERMKTNNKISKMIFLITVIYFVTWFPLLVFQCLPASLIMALYTKSKAGFTIVYMLILTLNVNHAINPIVYSFVNARFWRECKATFEWMKGLMSRQRS